MKTNITKGIFSDGHTGWKIGDRETNGVKGFEIHYSDDGECITDHVYEKNGQLLYFDINKVREVLVNL